MTVLGVGLVGASADYGWGKATHVPAIRAVPDLELRAVATRRQETADAASRAFEVAHAFGTVDALASHPDVDIVSVVVRAPGHGPALSAALRAGKHVYCEWPLGKDLADAEASARLAAAAGMHCAVGLQGRFSPWIRHIRDLVADGYVGRVLSTTLVVSDDFSVGSVARSNAYMLDPANGANPLSIHGGHFLDAFCFSLGEFVDLTARTATSIPHVTVRETGETVASHVPDQIAVIGRLESGATAVAQIRAGRVPGNNLHWDIQGSEGFVRISAETRYLHWGEVRIEGRRGSAPLERLDPPEALRALPAGVAPLDDPAANVARIYAAFARDILDGTRHCPGFDVAINRHRMIDAIARSAVSGTSQSYR